MLLKSKQRFRSKSHNVFTEEIRKIALSSNDDKIMKSIDSDTNHMEWAKTLHGSEKTLKVLI